MSTKRNPPKGKKINPHFWVFCEGATEEAYVSFLRSKYRVPIEIVSKIVGNRLNSRYINEFKRGKPTHTKDKDFLMYDADVSETLKNLQQIKSAILIASNPSIELWFLLHYKNQVACISTKDCIRELCNRNRNQYKKGLIDAKLGNKLNENYEKASEQAKGLQLFSNPSSNIYIFVEELINAKNVMQ